MALHGVHLLDSNCTYMQHAYNMQTVNLCDTLLDYLHAVLNQSFEITSLHTKLHEHSVR